MISRPWMSRSGISSGTSRDIVETTAVRDKQQAGRLLSRQDWQKLGRSGSSVKQK